MTTSKEEDKWFKEREQRLMRELRKREEREEDDEAAKRLREQHWMHCPKCGNELQTENHRGVAIDKCPVCHGVWLDEGELEALEGRSDGLISRIARVVIPKRTTRLKGADDEE